jgi:hypothetical protein
MGDTLRLNVARDHDFNFDLDDEIQKKANEKIAESETPANIKKNRNENERENENNDTDKTDFIDIGKNIFSSINYKIAFFIFVIGFIIFSDLFITSFLNSIEGAVDIDGMVTTKGTIIQLMGLTIAYIVVDLLAKKHII